MTKVCKKCGIEKDVSEFNKNKRSKDGLYSWCRDCANKQSREWYHANIERARAVQQVYVTTYPERVKETREKRKGLKREYQESRYQKGKRFLDSLKKPCAKCGESRTYVIDFHHINPDEKAFNVSEGATGRSFKSIETEANKCVCLCRNCHTEFHHIYGNLPTNPVEAIKTYLGEEFIHDEN